MSILNADNRRIRWKQTGSGTLRPEKLLSRGRAVKGFNRRAKEWWSHAATGLVLIILLSAADFVSLYRTFELGDTSTETWQNRIIVFVIAIVLNFLPILLARIMKDRRIFGKKSKHLRRAGVTISVVMLVVTFSILLFLSFLVRAQYEPEISGGAMSTSTHSFGDGFNVHISNSSGSSVTGNSFTLIKVSELLGGKDDASVGLYSFLPFCTSVTNFFIAWFANDPKRKKASALKWKRVVIEEAILDIEEGKEEYVQGNPKQALIEEDKKKYETTKLLIESIGKELRQKVL